jgi:endonuclease/exonuclease/phosphatase family metal-dependent hydrolase
MGNAYARILLLLICFLSAQSVQAAKALTMVSWNVWFDDETGKTRYPLVLQKLASQKADVIALQEVTPAFLRVLQQSGLQKKFHLTRTSAHRPYQNIFLSRQKPFLHKVITLPSGMSRSALMIGIKRPGGKKLYIVNVHLESPLEAGDVRSTQLATVHRLLKQQKNVIVTGDFNFGAGVAEERFFRRFYRDAADMPGYAEQFTYDVEKNHWAKRTKYKDEKSRRLDRFYMRFSDQYKWQYRLLNQWQYGNNLPLSDHYAIRLDLELD